MTTLGQPQVRLIGPGSDPGSLLPDGSASDLTFVLAGVTWEWGRSSILDQPGPAHVSFSIADSTGRAYFLGSVSTGTPVMLEFTAGDDIAHLKNRRFFIGQVASVVAGWDDHLGLPVVNVDAYDVMSVLAQLEVGAAPWPAETAYSRISRIIAAIGYTDRLPFGYPAGVAALGVPGQRVVSSIDIDRQPAADLLSEIATSAGWVMYGTVFDDFALVQGRYFLQLHDPATRLALRHLVYSAGTVTIASDTGIDAFANGLVLDACDVIDRASLQFSNTVDDVVTRVEGTYIVQGATTADNVQVTVGVRSAESETLGVRRATLNTQLTTSVDLQARILDILASTDASSWSIQGLSVELTPDDFYTTFPNMSRGEKLFQPLQALGLAILLTGLPYWSPVGTNPVPVYLEGGTYEWDGHAWTVDLNVSNGAGADSVTYQDLIDLGAGSSLGTAPYTAWSATINYRDLSGVHA